MEFFLIFICICLILGLVSNPNGNSNQKKVDKLPPDFFDNYYKRNKD